MIISQCIIDGGKATPWVNSGRIERASANSALAPESGRSLAPQYLKRWAHANSDSEVHDGRQTQSCSNRRAVSVRGRTI